jgi:hypothetical protein
MSSPPPEDIYEKLNELKEKIREIDKKTSDIDSKVLQNQTNRIGAIKNFLYALYNRGADAPFPIDHLWGVVNALLLPRAVIIFSGIITAAVLVAQTFLLSQQTDMQRNAMEETVVNRMLEDTTSGLDSASEGRQLGALLSIANLARTRTEELAQLPTEYQIRFWYTVVNRVKVYVEGNPIKQSYDSCERESGGELQALIKCLYPQRVRSSQILRTLSELMAPRKELDGSSYWSVLEPAAMAKAASLDDRPHPDAACQGRTALRLPYVASNAVTSPASHLRLRGIVLPGALRQEVPSPALKASFYLHLPQNADLAGAALPDANFSCMIAPAIQLGATVENPRTAPMSDLRYTRFDHAQLSEGKLNHSDMVWTYFDHANLFKASIQYSAVSQGQFCGAIIDGVECKNVKIKILDQDTKTCLPECPADGFFP